MEVIKKRAAFLSNYEVYSLLQEQERKHLAQARAAAITKQEDHQEELFKGPNYVGVEAVAENVRTVQVEMLQYLSSEYVPTSRQTAESVMRLTRGLREYGLTKAEKLQIVNLAPTTAVELYVLVEEIEERLSSQMDAILELVNSQLEHQPLFLPEDETLPPMTTMAAGEEEEVEQDWGEDPSKFLEEEEEEETGGDDLGLEIDEVPD